MKKAISIFLAIILIFSLVACGETATKDIKIEENCIYVEDNNYPLTITDYFGDKTVLKEKPKRVAVLSGTPLNIWYDLGGKSVCTSDISSNIRLTEGYEEEIKALPQIGPVYMIDMEAVMQVEPDFIISQVGTQTGPAAKLKKMGYQIIQNHIRSLKDVCDTYRAYGAILEKNELAEAKCKSLLDGKKKIVEKIPKDELTVAILYVTSKSIAVKLDTSIAGDIASILKLNNIASDLPPETIGAETTPLDIEYIVEKNPDIILVTSMVSSNELAKETLQKEFDSNPAWQTVRAIREGDIAYLPQEYFLYNAGPYYVDAIEYMAKCVYPDIFGEVE